MHGKRRGLLFVEGAEAGVVGGAGLAQADIALNHLDDVGLLLHGLGKIGHEVCIENKAGDWGASRREWITGRLLRR